MLVSKDNFISPGYVEEVKGNNEYSVKIIRKVRAFWKTGVVAMYSITQFNRRILLPAAIGKRALLQFHLM